MKTIKFDNDTTTTIPKATLDAQENISDTRTISENANTESTNAEYTDVPDTIAGRIRLIRNQAGLSQQQFADRIMVTRAAVSKWESGAGIPSVDSCQIIAREFHVSCDYLLLNSNMMKSPTKPWTHMWKPDTGFWRGYSKFSYICAIFAVFCFLGTLSYMEYPFPVQLFAYIGSMLMIFAFVGSGSWGYVEEKWKGGAFTISFLTCCVLGLVGMCAISSAYPRPVPAYTAEYFIAYGITLALFAAFCVICILIGIYRIRRDRRAGIGADVEPDETEIPSDNV